MSLMEVVAETLLLLPKVLWLWLVAVYRAVVPVRLKHHKDVSDWLALVTGSGSGLGRLLALRLARLGCRVVLWDLNREANEETAKLLRESHPGTEVWTYTVDLSSRDEIYTAAQQVKSEVGDVDILVNNAGIIAGTRFLDTTDEFSVKTMDVNVMAHIWTAKAFLPAMLRRDRGHVVTVASSGGLFGVPGMTGYCTSKFAAVGLTECLRLEILKYGNKGVQTTAVCPGYITTGLFQGFKYRFPLLIKPLQPAYVADKIIEAILTNQPFLCLPRFFYTMLILKGILPVAVSDALSEFSGVLTAMDDFVGRKED